MIPDEAWYVVILSKFPGAKIVRLEAIRTIVRIDRGRAIDSFLWYLWTIKSKQKVTIGITNSSMRPTIIKARIELYSK